MEAGSATVRRPRPALARARPPRPRPRPRTGVVLLVLVVATVGLRLVWLAAPLSSDEGGYLLVASQWRPGTSLYGSYWVDRPPLIVGIYRLAALAGGTVALRLLGCALVTAVVLLGHAVGRAVLGPGRACVWVAGAAAAFVSTPLFGVTEVNGELIAVPFVLAGVLAALRATTTGSSAVRARRWVLAGVLGGAAFMVKQSFLDVVVFGSVLLVATALARSTSRRGLVRDLAALLGGAVLTVGLLVALASTRGTEPGALWNALVTFRLHAVHVVDTGDPWRTAARFAQYPGILLLTGALVPLAALGTRLVKGARSPLVQAAAALVVWELLAMLAGASYWRHYLIGLIPGIVVATALTVTQWGPAAGSARTVKLSIGYAAGATALVAAVLTPVTLRASDPQIVGDWLAATARPGDTAVVLYGEPDILRTAGLQSPYPDLWALPMRVHDPRLTKLAAIMTGPHAPAWLVVDGALKAWGIQPTAARKALSGRYTTAARICGYHVYLRDGLRRDLPPRPPACDPTGLFR